MNHNWRINLTSNDLLAGVVGGGGRLNWFYVYKAHALCSAVVRRR